MINFLNNTIKAETVTIILIVVFSYISYVFGKNLINKILESKSKRVQTLKSTLNYILTILIWVMAITLILPEIGIEFSALIAGAGIVGLFLSLGTGTIIKDFFGGIVIIFEDLFDVGDEIEVKNLKGKVINFDLRKTTISVIKNRKEVIYYIPNSEMTVVANLSKKNKEK